MKKTKLLLIVLAACLLVGTATGLTVAYFTAQATSQNIFTAGNVTIQFTELAADGKTPIDVTGTTPAINYGVIYPGRRVEKKSTIKVLDVDGSMPAYLAAKIVITDGGSEYDIHSILCRPGTSDSKTKLDAFLQGGPWNGSLAKSSENEKLWSNSTYAVYYEEIPDGFAVYVLIRDAKAANESVIFLDSLNFPNTWSNAEFVTCSKLQLNISVFAVQAQGLGSCQEAMLSSFNEQFQVFAGLTIPTN